MTLGRLLKTARSQKEEEKPVKKPTQFGSTSRPYIEYIDLDQLEPIEEIDSNLPSEVDRKVHKKIENTESQNIPSFHNFSKLNFSKKKDINNYSP